MITNAGMNYGAVLRFISTTFIHSIKYYLAFSHLATSCYLKTITTHVGIITDDNIFFEVKNEEWQACLKRWSFAAPFCILNIKFVEGSEHNTTCNGTCCTHQAWLSNIICWFFVLYIFAKISIIDYTVNELYVNLWNVNDIHSFWI